MSFILFWLLGACTPVQGEYLIDTPSAVEQLPEPPILNQVYWQDCSDNLSSVVYKLPYDTCYGTSDP